MNVTVRIESPHRRHREQVREILRGVPLETPGGPRLLLFVREWERDPRRPPRDAVLVLRDR